MSENKRLRGEQVILAVSGPQGTIASIDAIQSAEVSHQIDILSEGYLGEVAERKDEIFMGVAGKLELHIETADYLRFLNLVIDKAQRRIPANTVFNITMTLQFPDGRIARVLYPNVAMGGDLPLNVSARDEYVSTGVDFEGSRVRFLF